MSEIARLSEKIPEVKKETKITPKQKTGFSRSTNSPLDRILFLQRNIGNQAVQKHIKSGTIQAKLRIGPPGDVYEQEADRVAEQVMRMPEPGAKERKNCSRQTTSIQRKCPKCKEDEEIQRKPEEKRNTGSVYEATPELEANINNLSGKGQPLPDSVRAFFEPRFGYDFSKVRVHSGADAGQSARDVSARAYTVGTNVVFGANQFAPGSTEGRRLLAHELTHVIQQGGADSTIVSQDNSETGDSTLQKHETIASDETVGDISRPSILSSGMMLQRAACPCCADSMSIGNINRIDNATHMGHSFDVGMGMSYPASGPTGSCTLEWWEKTNVPAIPGHTPNTWTEMYGLYSVSPTFNPWKNRSETCGTSSPVTITDPPALGKTPGRTVTRTLEFRIVINSMPPSSEGGCTAASKQVTAKQVLKMVNGAPDWAASSFTTP